MDPRLSHAHCCHCIHSAILDCCNNFPTSLPVPNSLTFCHWLAYKIANRSTSLSHLKPSHGAHDLQDTFQTPWTGSQDFQDLETPA